MAVSAADGQSPIDRSRRIGELLGGARDGVNTVFTTAVPFEFDPPRESPQVYYNGLRQRRGAGLDFTVAESGGPGTGFDTIMVAVPPLSPTPPHADIITADYTEE